MTAINILENIINNQYLSNYNFKYCLVDKNKIPYTINGDKAHPNIGTDFVDLNTLKSCPILENYVGIGISIKESNICAIDIDKCFKEKFNIDSADDRAKDILNLFKDKAYVEFSFSGTGLRILFKLDSIDDYSYRYYIKNSNNGCEYYQPKDSIRYVTITGNAIYNNPLTLMTSSDTLYIFLNKYMIRPQKLNQESIAPILETRSKEELLKLIKNHYIKNISFQNMWFDKDHYAFQQISKESDNDFRLLTYLYYNITRDKTMLRELFEESPYFKSKDQKHIKKWKYNNYRYYEYMFARI